MTTITLSDGSLRWDAELEGGVRGGISEHPVYASNEPEMGTLKQEDWVGGRGADNYHLDPTKFYDALNCWTLTPGHLHQTLQWKFAKNIRVSDFEMSGDMTWKALLGSQLYISRSFIAGASYSADKCYLWLRRRGGAGTLTLELRSDSAGDPGTVLKTVTLANVADVISVLQVFDWITTEALVSGTTYHIVVYGAAEDNAGSHWEVGVNASGTSSKIGGGIKQVETATITATITTAGNATITVTAVGMTNSPKAVSVAVALNDTAALVAGKVRTALAGDTDVAAFFKVSGATDKVVLTAKTEATNDTTMNIASANGTCVGITAASTSADTTAGVAPNTVWTTADFSMYYRVIGVDAGGDQQVETATVTATITTAGNATFTVKAANSVALVAGKAISVAVALNDTGILVAGKARTALAADADVAAFFDVSGATDKVILTAKMEAANDSTMNIASANGTCVGITAASTSANTTAGRKADRRFYRFNFDGLSYRVDQKADGAASQLWMNGDRGKATSATITTLVQTGKNWGNTQTTPPLSLGKTYTLTTPHTSFPDTGGIEMTDGIIGTTTPDAKWTGWTSGSPTARIDLGTAYALGHVRFHYLIDEVNTVYAPNQVVISGSNDDSAYTTLGTFVKTTGWTDGGGRAVYWSNNLAVTGSYRYVKFVFTPQTNWLFLSELEVYGIATSSNYEGVFTNAYVQILRGTGKGQIRKILDHDTTTLNVEAWTVVPDNTSEYVIYFTDYWTECTTTGLGEVTSKPIVAETVVYFPQGDSVVIRKMRNNAGAHEYGNETAKATILYGAYDTTGAPKVWRANNDTVTISVSEVATWATNLSFGGATKVGDTAHPITGMIYYNGDLWVFKEDRPWMQKNNRAIPADIDMSAFPGAANGAISVVHNKFLYISWANSLERLFGGTLDPIGPDRGRLPSNRKGVHAALEPVLGSLITSLDADTGTSSVMVWNGTGWHEIFRAWEAGKRIRDVGWQANEGARPRLWIDVGGELVYQEFPGGGETTPLDDSNMLYQHEGVFYSATIDARDPSVPKYFEEAYSVAKNLSTVGSVVYFDYQVDKNVETDNWIEGGSFLQAPLDEIIINEGNVKQFRYRLRINSASASTPVDITSIGIKVFARTPLKYAWDLRVAVNKIRGDDPSGFLAWLKEKAENAERVLVTTSIPELDGHYCKVKPPTLVRNFQNPEEDLNWGGVVLVTLQD